MKRAAVLTSVVVSLMNVHGAKAVDARPGHQHKKSQAHFERQTTPPIRVADGAWGNATPAQIELLLNAVADEMLVHFPGRKLEPIVVSPSQHGPVVLYQKGPENEYQVLLAAKDQQWAEYVYEFSHELFHILAHYEYHPPPHNARHQWFEEMLCETVSLYMLRHFSLAPTSTASLPLPQWSDYIPTLQAFTQRALSEPHRQLPADVSFEQWFRENGPSLISRPYLREKNELVANLFLPFLEQHRDWRAVTYLNVNTPQEESSFYDFFVQWYRTTPPAHRKLVGEAMQIFRFKKPSDHDRVLAGDPAAASPPGTTQTGVDPSALRINLRLK